MSRRKAGSLLHQMKRELQKLDCIGQSKHEAKKLYRAECESQGIKWNPAQANGIHSIATMRAYEQTSREFATWMKEKHPEVRKVSQIEREHLKSYLQDRQSQGLSAWSVSKDMSALNKIFNEGLTKKEVGLQERSYKNSTRSRVERHHDKEINRANYKEQIEFASAFGLRRESILGGQYQVKDSSLYKLDGKLYVGVIEKGGRYRNAPCLESHQKLIEAQIPNIEVRDSHMTKDEFKQAYEASGEVLFDRYPKRIDNHELRHQYARELYNDLVNANGHENIDYRGYDKQILQEVSHALGHNRLDVVVESYLR